MTPPDDDARDERSRELEARGRQALEDERPDEALRLLSEAYQLGDRASLRFLLARAFGAHAMRATVDDRGALVAFSPDGALLAIAHGSEVALWLTETGRRTKQLPAPAAVTALAWNPRDATQLIVASEIGAQFYDVARGRASVIDGVRGRLELVAWGARARAAVAEDGKYALADLSPPRETMPLAQRPLAITAERALVCGAEVCELVSTHGDIEIPVIAVRAVFGDDTLAIASATEVHVVDLLGRERSSIAGAFTELALSGDGTRLATGSPTGTQIWDTETGALLEAVPGTLRALSHDGTWLATETAGLQLWHLPLESRTPAEVQAVVR